METIKLIATDLDGTFLKNDKSISSTDLNTLIGLGEKGIKRVIATGRNLKKVHAVIPAHIPFDYIIYSSGAGIFDCAENKHIYSQNLSVVTSKKIAEYFVRNKISFHAFHAVPDNHMLWYHRGSDANKEFDDYYMYHHPHAIPFPEIEKFESELCQFLMILPNDEIQFNQLKQELLGKFEDIGVIRTTSPLHSGNIWMEVFHKSISKGEAVARLCHLTGIQQKHTLGIGNDYNDIELLDFTYYSYLTANGPEVLKSSYKAAPSNEDDAFTFAVSQHI